MTERVGRGGVARVATWAGIALVAGSAWAGQPDGGVPGDADGGPARRAETRIDQTTGRHLAWWTRGPQVDLLHMRLEITIPDMEVTRMEAVERLTVRGLATARESLTLDAQGLEIESVRVDGVEARFVRDDGTVSVWFPGGAIAEGQERTIEFRFVGEYPVADGLGLNWSVGDPGGSSETDRFAQIHSQGQSENNSRWFVCHDAPNERLSTEIIVRLPEPFTVISNGRLVSRGVGDSDLVEWHFLQQRAHPAYLVTLVVGVFDEVKLSGPGIDGPTQVPMTVYGPVGTAENLEKVFAGVPGMMEFFERWLDEPYPWDKYDQVCVRNFHSGGMENTSATTLYEEAARSRREREEDLISHELAHMWFGDLVTCRTWDHLWLNEGWATYSEVLWREERARQEAREDGLDEGDVADEGRRAMLEYMLQLMRFQRRFNRARAPMDEALVSNLYRDPESVFEKVDDPYNKGAAVLHMLRMTLGNDLFQRGTRLYLDRFKDQVVETDDFRRCLEEVSGRSLERFFVQWVNRPGLPRLDVSIRWDDAAGQLVVGVEQTQPIDADNPAYWFDLPIEVRTGDRSVVEMVRVDSRSHEARIDLAERPEQVAVDPDLSVFAATSVDKDLTWWRRELEAGSTVAVRAMAAEAVAAHEDSGFAEWLLLAQVAGDSGEAASVREAASQGAATLLARGLVREVVPIAGRGVSLSGKGAL